MERKRERRLIRRVLLLGILDMIIADVVPILP